MNFNIVLYLLVLMSRKLKGRLGNNLKGCLTRSLGKFLKWEMKVKLNKLLSKMRKMMASRARTEMSRRNFMKLQLMHVEEAGSIAFGLLVADYFLLLDYKDVPYCDIELLHYRWAANLGLIFNLFSQEVPKTINLLRKE